ncbi:hypothetical protein P152DRAFT_13383 [Eremomyces bilateralis CBS 781.70]|uniref:Rpr2-domain-containing protein n=1 Tax=Eremomyces bilateralis CBS 781.70 TaxID=1392243 RepID=A0A6G1GGU9_9PEZI|nr:uncharacterized protein P152DRAFT_13383 [Eremomyces bilateralis CBS 781.70]KAF1817273.1 hypothetical protein P152DRAFT_13383 [Eremomyces bilateralis CBS 781.70]
MAPQSIPSGADANADAARLRFLQGAAKALTVAAPGIASHIATDMNRLFPPIPSAPTPASLCMACGLPLQPGTNCKVSIHHTGTSRIKRRAYASFIRSHKGAGCRVLRCSRCNSETLELIKKKSVADIAPAEEQLATEAIRDQVKAITATAKTSKQRAKERKQRSLQGLLSKAKSENPPSSSGFGLNLMDFMKHR